MANPNNSGPLLVSGASGQLGRRVLELLLADPRNAGRKLIALTRTPDKLSDLAANGVEVRAASFDDASSLANGFRGAERALIISTDALDRPGRRLEQHANAVRAAKASGVEHVVYTSLTHCEPSSLVTLAPDHWGTETILRESELPYTVLRNNMYTDYLLLGLPYAVKSGQIVNSHGAGKVSYVTREDCARAAAHALSGSFRGRAVLDITGPKAITQAELAAIVGEIVGKSIAYLAVDAATAVANNVGAGLPAPVAELLVSFERSASAGQLAVESSSVQDLTGSAPSSVKQFLSAQRAALG
jgi:NAD(P)H dehydrogenase (quinone)